MNQNNYIGQAVEELYRIFNVLNKHYYNGELPVPIITIQTGRRLKAAGWFTLEKVWKDRNDKEESKHEINICAESLNESTSYIVDSMQHEMVHYYNKLAEIKDCSGQMHNKKFKQQAERVGLVCTRSGRYGWGDTKPSPMFEDFITSVVKPNGECFQYFRSVAPKVAKEKQKKLFKYTCDDCKIEAKAKPDIKLVCGECGQIMQMEEE